MSEADPKGIRDDHRDALALILAISRESRDEVITILDAVEAEGRMRELARGLAAILLEVRDNPGAFSDEKIGEMQALLLEAEKRDNK